MSRVDKAINNILGQLNWTPPPYRPYRDDAWREMDSVVIDLGHEHSLCFDVSVLLDVLDPPKKGKKT